MNQQPDYKQLRYWISTYGHPDTTDQRAVHTFIDCESREAISILRAELIGIKNGNYDPEKMQGMAGAKRLQKHGTFEQWASYMLMWLAEYKG